jgi:hypothetical protein
VADDPDFESIIIDGTIIRVAGQDIAAAAGRAFSVAGRPRSRSAG